MTFYNIIRHHIVPPIFVAAFTASIQLFSIYGRGDSITWKSSCEGLFGNLWTWLVVGLSFLWAYLWLIVSGPIIKGPASPTGYVPVYKNNGILYYFATVSVYLASEVLTEYTLSRRLYDEMSKILGTLNIVALALCIHLFQSPSDDHKSDEDLPPMFIFYRGRNFHPRILGVDVKQLTICRIGMMAFQIFVLAFFIVNCSTCGFSLAAFTTFFLHSIYMLKFFYWEGGYFHTIDVMLDRAGYYLCWGCIVWVPCFFTYNSYYIVHYCPKISSMWAWLALVTGVISISTQYNVDAQRMHFRSSNGKCVIWGKTPKYITATYTDYNGKTNTSLLLTSGFWGLSRHLNYALEIVYAFCVCLPAYTADFTPFLYFVFMVVLLVHRVYRDDEKCRHKYGPFWGKYCNAVPYKMIPYLF